MTEHELIRYEFQTERTFGKWAVAGLFFCHTLEDTVRDGPKIRELTEAETGIGLHGLAVESTNRKGQSADSIKYFTRSDWRCGDHGRSSRTRPRPWPRT